jgi:DNA helicase HerA-like ATPase
MLMKKIKPYQKNYKSNYSKPSFAKGILKSLIPYLMLIIFGIISFVLIFPEVLSLIPLDFFGKLSSLSERFGTAFKDFVVFVFTNKYFLFSSLGLLFFIITLKFLPYRTIQDGNLYTQKKILVPLYRKVCFLLVSSPTFNSSNIHQLSSYASKIHNSFLNSLLVKSKRLTMVIIKNRDDLAIFFPVIIKGWNKNRIEKQIENQTIFLSNSIDTHYCCKVRKIEIKQTNALIQFVNELNSRCLLDLSSENFSEMGLMNQIYGSLMKKEVNDTCFIIKLERSKKHDQKVAPAILLLTENKNVESYILNACGINRKKSRIKNKGKIFLEYLGKTLRYKVLWEINNSSALFHIPHNYKGGTISHLGSNLLNDSPNLNMNQDKIIIGRTLEEDDSNQDISINIGDLLLNMEIYGMIGRGKTRLVSSIVEQLLDKKVSTIIFDIKGEYARTFVEDPRVEIFTIGKPRPLCINIFETLDDDDVRNTLLIIEEMMMSSNQEFTPAMKNLFENALFLTHKSSKRNIETFIDNLFKVSKQLQSNSNISYMQQTIDAVLNRLNFIFNPINFEILGTTKTTLDFSLLKAGKSIILDLSQFQRRAARPSDIFLICNLILKLFYRYATSEETSSQLRYVVVLEEAINIIPNFYHSESSASLITAENNFLLGRSLGIGNITISQLWNNVSNIVHGNSATKIIFRSSEKTESIGRALNLNEEEIAKIQRLPTQHCYIFLEELENAIRIKTLDLTDEPFSYSEYRAKLLRRYEKSIFPLLYNNFIAMRTNIYQKNQQYLVEKTPKNPKFSMTDNRGKLDSYLSLMEKKQDVEEQSKTKEKENEDLTVFNDMIPENLICERLCPEKNSDRDCLKYNMGAKIIKNSIMSQSNPENLLKLLNDEDDLFSLILGIASKRNLDFNDFLVFCTIKNIIIDLFSSSLISPKEAYKLLKQFSPKVQAKIINDI